jgi:hypothetical protein
MLWNGMMFDEIGRGLKGSDRALMKVLSQDLPGGTEEIMKDFSQDIQCPGQCLNRAPPEYESRALLPC